MKNKICKTGKSIVLIYFLIVNFTNLNAEETLLEASVSESTTQDEVIKEEPVLEDFLISNEDNLTQDQNTINLQEKDLNKDLVTQEQSVLQLHEEQIKSVNLKGEELQNSDLYNQCDDSDVLVDPCLEQEKNFTQDSAVDNFSQQQSNTTSNDPNLEEDINIGDSQDLIDADKQDESVVELIDLTSKPTESVINPEDPNQESNDDKADIVDQELVKEINYNNESIIQEDSITNNLVNAQDLSDPLNDVDQDIQSDSNDNLSDQNTVITNNTALNNQNELTNQSEQKKYSEENPLLNKESVDLDTQNIFNQESTTQKKFSPIQVVEANDFKVDDLIDLNINIKHDSTNDEKALPTQTAHVEVLNGNIQIRSQYQNKSKKYIQPEYAHESYTLKEDVSMDNPVLEPNEVKYSENQINKKNTVDSINVVAISKYSKVLGSNSFDSLDSSKINELSIDANSNGCSDTLENNKDTNQFCNFLNLKLQEQGNKLKLNLDRVKNLFTTNRVVLNGSFVADTKVELHLKSKHSDKILSILETDVNGNFLYILETKELPVSGVLYLKSQNQDVSIDYNYQIDIQSKVAKPVVFSLCESPYSHQDNKVLCNPENGFNIKVKSDYNMITKAYFNSTVYSGVTATNSYTNIGTINPNQEIFDHLKSGSMHRVILQNVDPLNPDNVSEPVEVYYKVHYPIFNPVLLPLFILLSLLGVVSLYDLYKFKKSENVKQTAYETYNIYKNITS
jgi:hypothetical protein